MAKITNGMFTAEQGDCEVMALEISTHADTIVMLLRFTGARLLRGHPPIAHPVQIRQAEEHVHLRQILFDSPIAHRRMPPTQCCISTRAQSDVRHSGEVRVVLRVAPQWNDGLFAFGSPL